MRQHIDLYIFNGLAPSPRVEIKFKPQRADVVHGNDFIYQAFGPNAERRHRRLECFFVCQNPVIDIPSRDEYPNWKIRPLIKWINYISPRAWLLGKSIFIDEMTICFQGHHRDKLRITYKNEGGGFQCDALCDDGFAYQVYFRNDPAEDKYLKMGMSPLHSIVVSLLDTVKDKYHIYGMDNLYNSAIFTKACYKHPKKVLVQCTCMKGGRGLPPEVVQQDVTGKKSQREVRGTVKAAVLQGDINCPDLVASSIYDTIRVHFLSMACDTIKWIPKVKKVYNVDTGCAEELTVLRLNRIDDYNNTMGGVDIVDQLRGTYRPDH